MDLTGLSFVDNSHLASEAAVDFLKVLIYGPSGGGKSSCLASMPDPVLVLLTEKQGEMSIRRVNPKARIIYIEDTIVCKCHRKPAARCPEGAKKGTEKMKAKEVLYGAIDELATKKHPFLSVALDSLTDLQQILLSDMKGGKVGAKVAIQEWGVLIEYVKDVVIRLRNLNMHVGIICLNDEIQDNTQRVLNRPALAGKKLPGQIIQFFNLCGFQRKTREDTSTVAAIYETVFDAGSEYYTKTHPALEPIEPPSFRSWAEKIAKFSAANHLGQMPSASSPVSAVVSQKKPEDDLQRRVRQPKIKELFDKLNAPEAKRLATADKYRSDEKLIEILEKRLKEQEKDGDAGGENKELPGGEVPADQAAAAAETEPKAAQA
jgi:hypothetical protein